MKEYQEHLEYYSIYWFMHFSKSVPESNWGNINLAEKYLNKYWLTLEEYNAIWKPILNNMFVSYSNGLPDLKFNSGYEVVLYKGGCLFLEKDFIELQKCILALEERYFVVYENTFGSTSTEPAFRMKFPSDITWEELNSGNYISALILESNHKEFFVLSESQLWGKYAASDYDTPLDIIGFKPEIEDIFARNFKEDKVDWSEKNLNN